MSFKRFLLFALVLAAVACLLASTVALAQSFTTGEISGTVTDPSGAVLPNVSVSLKSVEKGYTQSATTSAQGAYRFSLLAPGNYTVSAALSGFKTTTESQAVSVGAVAITNIKMEVGTTGTVVEVTGEAPLLQTDSSEISTSMNALAVSSLPNPGNDLSFIAQTAPGSVMNTEAGYGNFSSYGISATSNLFTMNGMYDNDPFLNLNNSGATNLLLGNNEVQEVDVVSNGYSGQFGGFAGATVNYITKSGSNQWHGNAAYWWNGRVMNANDYFNKQTDPITPRSFDNANQYAASFGGPIKKDKAFFFFNYEGLRVLIPTSQTVQFPSAGFQAATLANLAKATCVGCASEIPFYNQMFNLWNSAPGAAAATLSTSTASCGGFNYTGAATAPTLPCTSSFRSTIGNLTHEFLMAGRFDFNLTSSDKLFIRAQEDKGLQASFTDPVNKLFNTQSTQPEYQSQISWNHSFGTKAVNNLVISATYYSAIFEPANLAATKAAYPATLIMGDGSFLNSGNPYGAALGGEDFIFPQGRNVTQYQAVDDYSYSLGAKHTLKLGLNFHRYDIGDHDYGLFNTPILEPFSIQDFFNGGSTGDVLEQTFATSLAHPIAIYGLGWYIQDEWRVSPTLKLTFDLRMDHNSNAVCQDNCFARLTSAFDSLDHSASIPYNRALSIGQHQALASFTPVEYQPRFGFAWTPPGLKNTVLRGGFGIFGDTFPGQVADLLSQNPPYFNTFVAANGLLAPASPNSLWAQTTASNAAFVAGFSNGGTLASISAADPLFSPPAVNSANTIHYPTYEEWNLQVEQSIGRNTSFNINYVGNHGYHESVQNNGVNGFCPVSVCPGGFVGLPAAAPDPRFNVVTQVVTEGVSNYNGLVASVQHRFSQGLQLQGSFSWSHALDEISNGGFNPFTFSTNESLITPENPNNLRGMYGNADYDTRKYASLSYVYQLPYWRGPKPLAQGWQVSGTLFTRSGLPYTIIDAADSAALSSFGYGAKLFGNYNGAPQPSCGTAAASASFSSTSPCLVAADFSTAISATGVGGFGSQRRNQFYGPGYFDTDFTVMKYTGIPHWESAKVGLGLQFFNLFNHPNFDQPFANIASTATFGQISHALGTPTSILGSFLGGDASPRLIQLTAKFNF